MEKESKIFTLDEMILKAIPINDKCAIEEQYNKLRRKLLKERFDNYLADQLSKQFNARPIIQEHNEDSNELRLGRSAE